MEKRSVSINSRLYEDIREYCGLNGIKTNTFIEALLAKAFAVEKFGDRPFAKEIFDVDPAEEGGDHTSLTVIGPSGNVIRQETDEKAVGLMDKIEEALEKPGENANVVDTLVPEPARESLSAKDADNIPQKEEKPAEEVPQKPKKKVTRLN